MAKAIDFGPGLVSAPKPNRESSNVHDQNVIVHGDRGSSTQRPSSADGKGSSIGPTSGSTVSGSSGTGSSGKTPPKAVATPVVATRPVAKPTAPTTGPTPKSPAKRSSGVPWLLIAGAVIVIALILAAIIFTLGGDGRTAPPSRNQPTDTSSLERSSDCCCLRC
ncbi:MAG: hypothetical protein U0894_16850 [Pirellulales bacterium]